MEDISAVGHRIHDAAKKGSIEDVAKLLKLYPQLVNDKVCTYESDRMGKENEKY